MAEAAVKRYLPWVVATALFMEQLDSTIVNTAVPSMAASLGVARSIHTATLRESNALRFDVGGAVWQRTGEDWNGVGGGDTGDQSRRAALPCQCRPAERRS